MGSLDLLGVFMEMFLMDDMIGSQEHEISISS